MGPQSLRHLFAGDCRRLFDEIQYFLLTLSEFRLRHVSVMVSDIRGVRRGKNDGLEFTSTMSLFWVIEFPTFNMTKNVALANSSICSASLYPLLRPSLDFHPTFSLPRHSPSTLGLCSRLHKNVPLLGKGTARVGIASAKLYKNPQFAATIYEKVLNFICF